MRAFPILLCVILAATGLAPAHAAPMAAPRPAPPVRCPRCATIRTFLQMNSALYEYMGEALPELEERNVSVTLFVPMLNNVTAPQAAAYPDLFLDLVLPEVYRDPMDLATAGSVVNLANVTIALEDDPGMGVIHATFLELGNATADIIPVAFPLGKSVAYLISPMTYGNLG
ncbi:hypothetical protein ABPG77_010035 [Micractinium sp. CCAP 211/92]